MNKRIEYWRGYLYMQYNNSKKGTIKGEFWRFLVRIADNEIPRRKVWAAAYIVTMSLLFVIFAPLLLLKIVVALLLGVSTTFSLLHALTILLD